MQSAHDNTHTTQKRTCLLAPLVCVILGFCWYSAIALRIATAALGKVKSLHVHTTLTHSVVFAVTEDVSFLRT